MNVEGVIPEELGNLVFLTHLYGSPFICSFIYLIELCLGYLFCWISRGQTLERW